MRIWVTGAAGFVGRYTTSLLKESGHEVFGSDVVACPDIGVESLDIRDFESVVAYAKKIQPDACVHLAGIAFVPDAAKNPGILTAINVDGSVNVGKAILAANSKARMLFVSSAQVYGYKYREEPMRVEDEVRPSSPYAKSKVDAENELLKLHREEGLNLVIARPGNHTGPGQSPKFVVPSFVHEIIRFKSGESEAIGVGNLESERDFTDVRDVVNAYQLILEKGESGGLYNVAAGFHKSIGELLESLSEIAGISPVTKVDPALFRPTDAMPAIDTAHTSALGWKPQFDFQQTLQDIWHSINSESQRQ